MPQPLIFGTVDNESWRCWQAGSAWYLWFQRNIGCAGAVPMPAPHLRAVASGAYPLTPLSSLVTTARACFHSALFFPYGKDGFAPLPLPGSGSPLRTELLPQQESAHSQARGCSACTSPSACCASSLQGIARDGWGALWRQGQCPPLRSGWRRLGTSWGVTPALDAPTQGLASVLVDRCSVASRLRWSAVLPVC